MVDKQLTEALNDLKVIDTLPSDITIALHSFVTACEGMMEYDLEHVPTEYFIGLIETMGKYPKYKAMANHLALVVLEDFGHFDK